MAWLVDWTHFSTLLCSQSAACVVLMGGLANGMGAVWCALLSGMWGQDVGWLVLASPFSLLVDKPSPFATMLVQASEGWAAMPVTAEKSPLTFITNV